MKQIITIVVIILLGVLQTVAQNANCIKQAHSRQLKARYHTTLAQFFEQRMKVACEDSTKISALIRYFAIT